MRKLSEMIATTLEPYGDAEAEIRRRASKAHASWVPIVWSPSLFDHTRTLRILSPGIAWPGSHPQPGPDGSFGRTASDRPDPRIITDHSDQQVMIWRWEIRKTGVF